MSALSLPAPLRLPLAALLAFLLSISFAAGDADAKAKAKKKRATLPSVSTVTPLKASIGDLLIIKGKNFAASGKSTVLFRKASGGRFVFATTLAATSTRLTVKVPEKIVSELDVADGFPVQTRFQLRVVSARATGSFTAIEDSPIILPPVGGSSTNDCDKDGVADGVDADDDNDGLSDAIEVQYKLSTCNVDTDGDTMWDSWEFESALDLNYRSLPYPGKKPWPNPLDSSDSEADFDGDGLYMKDEHKLWQAAGRPFPLNYSDGDQYTGGPVVAPNPDLNGLDVDAATFGGPPNLRKGVGYLSDDEKDYDGDGLSNVSEFHFAMTKGYWDAYSEDAGEGIYNLRPFADPDPTDPDSDGDGVLDGADDQDADGWSNIAELYRRPVAATNYVPYMVNPYNPCLPDHDSRSCSRYVPFGNEPWAPFALIPLPTAPIGWNVATNKPTDSPTPDWVPGS